MGRVALAKSISPRQSLANAPPAAGHAEFDGERPAPGFEVFVDRGARKRLKRRRAFDTHRLGGCAQRGAKERKSKGHAGKGVHGPLLSTRGHGVVLVTVARVSRPRNQFNVSLVNVFTVLLLYPSLVDTVICVALP